MLQFHLLPLIIILIPQISLLPALPVLPDPDPAPILTPSPPSTITAFPEQSSDSASSSSAAAGCPLNLSDQLLRGVSRACSPSPFRSSTCCPALAVSLYSAYSAAALSGGARASAIPASARPYDLPLLPDDSESCAAEAEAAIRARGVALPHVNGTCGVAYCLCGIRLRRLACPGPFAVTSGEGRWDAGEETARRLEADCARPGLGGCTRCLRTLKQLKSRDNSNVTGSDRPDGPTDCQLMGLTWLLSKNRTLYLPTAAAVLRSFMAASGGGAGPTSCSVPGDWLPVAVGSAQIDGDDSSAAPQQPLISLVLLIILCFFI